MPLHLSLIAALSKHAPTDLPYLASEPLYYHWFFHAHAAAAGHATGIDHLVLLNRLCPVPLHTVVVLGAAVLTQRLSRLRPRRPGRLGPARPRQRCTGGTCAWPRHLIPP